MAKKAGKSEKSAGGAVATGGVVADPGATNATLPAVAPADGLSDDPKKARIIAAAEDVMRAKGYASMTTLEVAQAAGISKRDLYARFATKDALVAAMVAKGVREMLAPVQFEPPMSRAMFYGGLQAFGAKFTNDMLAKERLGFYRLAIAEAEQNPAIARALLVEGTRTTADAIGEYFGQAQARGFVKFANLDAAVGAYFFMLIGDRMVTHLLEPSRVVTAEENARHVGLALMIVSALDQVK